MERKTSSREAGGLSVLGWLIVIVIIVALVVLALIFWQKYYPHEKAADKSELSIQPKSEEQIKKEPVAVDDSLADQFDNACKNPSSVLTPEICTDQNKTLRADVAQMTAAVKTLQNQDSKLLTNGTVLYPQQSNKAIDSYTQKLSTNVKKVTVLDKVTAEVAGSMDFGDMIVLKNSKCNADHYGTANMDGVDTMTVTTRFYNTPVYYCQDVK